MKLNQFNWDWIDRKCNIWQYKILFKIMQTLKSVGFKILWMILVHTFLNMLKDMPIDVLKLDRQFFITVGNAKRVKL